MKRRTKPVNSALSATLIRRPIQRLFPIFLLPTFVAFCIGFIYPFGKGIYLSFCKFTTTTNAKWIGFGNYLKAFNDASFMHAFQYTALVAIVSLIVINVLAFAVAYALTRGIKGSNSFRTVFFMPNLIGGIVLGYIWSMIFDGILSRYGTSIVLSTTYGYWGLIILMAWQQIGYMMIIYIAGLQSVPGDLIEAAKIDGATHTQIFYTIIFPLITPILAVNVLLSFIGITSDFVLASVVLSTPESLTLAVGLQQFVSDPFSKDWAMFCAGAILSAIPVVALFLYLQKYIVSGLTGGAVKG